MTITVEQLAYKIKRDHLSMNGLPNEGIGRQMHPGARWIQIYIHKQTGAFNTDGDRARRKLWTLRQEAHSAREHRFRARALVSRGDGTLEIR
jgi:hypothetical protein